MRFYFPLALCFLFASSSHLCGDELKPNQAFAQELIDKFLSNASEVEDDFSCWSTCTSFGFTANSDIPVDRTSIQVVGHSRDENWKFWATRMSKLPGNPPSPHWFQYLRTKRGMETRLGTTGRGKFFGADAKQPPKLFHYGLPVFRAILTDGAFEGGTATEAAITSMFFERESFSSGQFKKQSRDFVGIWVMPGRGFTVELEITFSKAADYFPVRAVYTHVQEGSRTLFEVIGTDWETVNKLRVPNRVRSVREDCAGGSHVEAELKMDWKLGDDNPDQPFSNGDTDWRLVLCDLFEQQCYVEAERMALRSTLRAMDATTEPGAAIDE